MKKTKILYCSLICLSLFSCNNNEGNNVEEPSFVYKFIEEASKSYTMNALEVENVSRLTGELLYKSDINYFYEVESDTESRIHIGLSNQENVYEVKLVKDNRGYAATESINYKNEIITNYALDANGSKYIYEKEHANPFSLISEDDLIQDEENKFTYHLSETKNVLFAKYFCMINYAVDDISFIFNEDESLNKIAIKSNVFEGIIEDAYTGNYIKANYSYTLDASLKKIGSTEVEGLKPVVNNQKDKLVPLKNALDKLGKNFTIIMNTHDRDAVANNEYDEIWYFDGVDEVYHQQNLEDTSRRYDLYYAVIEEFNDNLLRHLDFNEETSKWEYSSPIFAQSYNANPQSYDYFLPKYADVSLDLFNYNEEKKCYEVTNEYVIGQIGNNFLPGSYALGYFTEGLGDKCEIYLDSEERVDKIVVGYTYLDTQGFELPTDIEMTFVNIGTTQIPNWVKG